MRAGTCADRSSGWRQDAQKLMLTALPLRNVGRLVTDAVLAQALIYLCVARSTLSHAVASMGLPMSDETLRKAWRSCMPTEQQLQRLLASSVEPWRQRLSKSRRRRGYDVAIDLHHCPYYGQLVPGLYRGAAKQGTKRFWSYGTAVVVHRGERLTLAVALVTNNHMEDVLQALWPQLQNVGIKIRRVLLDRGFYGAKPILWLQRQGLAFLMPMIRRGRPSQGKRQATGTAGFFRRGLRGFTSYTWRERNRGEYVTVQVAIVPQKDRRRRPLVYAYSGSMPNLTTCGQWYRKRFGIETSYRQARRSHGWTTSHDPRWRALLMVASLVIRNLWIRLTGPQHSRPRSDSLTYTCYLETLFTSLTKSLTDNNFRQPP